MPPGSLSTLAVIKPGPNTAKKASTRNRMLRQAMLRRRLFLGGAAGAELRTTSSVIGRTYGAAGVGLVQSLMSFVSANVALGSSTHEFGPQNNRWSGNLNR